MNNYDVIIVGGGHAGVEAAWVCSKMNTSVALITLSLDKLCELSCNPAIGGQGKGQLVKEMDILGAIMPLAADKTGIQFKRLNTKKGPAVWSSRSQNDRLLYSPFIYERIQTNRLITLIEDEAAHIYKDGANFVIETINQKISSTCVIVASGTFLNGLIHVGTQRISSGRLGEPSAKLLSKSITQLLGIPWRRFKTGTPARLDAKTLDYSQLIIQKGDESPSPFSLWSDQVSNKIYCYLTHTNKEVHEIIRNNIDRAPLFNGQIQSTGARYCPSIEDKVMRFPDRDRHQLFLEPESLHSEFIYINGLPTSLPMDIQDKIIASIRGISQAKILKYGYAIEYDCIDPRMLTEQLEYPRYPGLFFAGQVNGTSGYEEAAAQGIVAGISAVCRVKKLKYPQFNRANSYIGVLVDDIIHQGTDEPYRLFTSRCEYRLSVREDNAIYRLLPISKQYGLLSDEQIDCCERIMENHKQLKRHLGQSKIWANNKWVNAESAITGLGMLMDEWIEHMKNSHQARPGFRFRGAPWEYIYIECKYAGYLDKERRAIDRLKTESHMALPPNLNFGLIHGLSNESKARLMAHKPKTIGEARQVFGVTPADILVLLRHVTRLSLAKPPQCSTWNTRLE